MVTLETQLCDSDVGGMPGGSGIRDKRTRQWQLAAVMAQLNVTGLTVA
jgi:hypothetical protein